MLSRAKARTFTGGALLLCIALSGRPAAAQAGDPATSFRLEPQIAARALGARFTAPQIALLEKLNRADAAHLPRLKHLVVPEAWPEDELAYSPFAHRSPEGDGTRKLLVVDLAVQAFAAYEDGRLIRWGPVSSGRRSDRTPSGRFHLNWRSKARFSTVDPDWYMTWYFNFENTLGLALHAYALPGYPASHGCVRLLERDAMWLYDWGEESEEDSGGPVAPGTPLLIVGEYDDGAAPPWQSLARLRGGVRLP